MKNNIENYTLDYYNAKAKEYFENTQNLTFDNNREILLKYLKERAHILDLGCGSGRDSKVLKEKGYIVTSIDGSEELCKFASKYLNEEVICKRFQDIDDIELYDAVWACASLLHLPLKQLEDVLYKILKSLKPSGYFYLTFKYGEFEGKRDERYFIDMSENKFNDIIKNYRGFQVIEYLITNDVRENRQNEKWLNIILKKV